MTHRPFWLVTPADGGRAHRGRFGRLDDALDFAHSVADTWQCTLFVWRAWPTRGRLVRRRRFVVEPDLPPPPPDALTAFIRPYRRRHLPVHAR